MKENTVLEYNTERDLMVIPEYGRNVQNMIGVALTIEDKVAFLDLHHAVPEGAKKIGNAHFQDSGFSDLT